MEFAITLETRLEESKVCCEEACQGRNQLCITRAVFIKEDGAAQREASDMRTLVTEPELVAIAPSISLAELADAVRERDGYRFSLQAVEIQDQGLPNRYANIVGRAECI